MSRQTLEQVNEVRRKRYAKRIGKPYKDKTTRDFGIVGDRVSGLSLQKIATKRGCSVGCVRGVIERYSST